VRWYLSQSGQAEGPYEEGLLVQWIQSGRLGVGNVCPEGGSRWTPLAQTAPFAAVLGHRAAAVAPRNMISSPQIHVADARAGRSPTAPGVPAMAMPPVSADPTLPAAAISPPSKSPPSSGSEPLPPAPWAAGLGQTQRMAEDDAEIAEDQAWRDTPEVVNRIGRRTESQIPPSGESELASIEPPPGVRTPSKPLDAIDFGKPLPASAPLWMRHAQRMIAGLQDALRQATIDPSTEASIERAWAGWELDGSNERQIARLALLIEQTHTALRHMPANKLERAVFDCAEVLRQGIPKHIRRRVPIEDVVQITRELRQEADAWVAVVNAATRLLGWQQMALAHAAHAIRLALQSTHRRA